jgi:hypothetical protein
MWPVSFIFKIVDSVISFFNWDIPFSRAACNSFGSVACTSNNGDLIKGYVVVNGSSKKAFMMDKTVNFEAISSYFSFFKNMEATES